MSVLRNISSPFQRLPSNVSGQTIVTYAIAVCLFAAALVLATSLYHGDVVLPEIEAAESGGSEESAGAEPAPLQHD